MRPHLRKILRRRILLPGIAAAALSGWFGLPLLLPLPPSLDSAPQASPVILDRHGRELHRLTLPDHSRTSPVSLKDLPTELIDCTIAAEDKRFRSHDGLDFAATFRSVRDAVVSRRATSGASTITQQLVKLASPPAPRTARTKLKEALLARHLEMEWTKDRILAAYFDRLPYGNLRTGPVEAARFYFGKPVRDLSLGECALLAGLPQAPSRLDPLRHPDRAEARRATVLRRLAATGKYDADRIAAALAEPIVLRRPGARPVAPWLPAASPGKSARTTIDGELQRDVETIVRRELAVLHQSNVGHAAVVVLHNPTREILALVHSGDWDDPRGGRINGALVPRSPGSALKPFTWLLAFEKGGCHPGSIVADIPTRFRTTEGLDAPENFDRTFRGPVTIREALACSLNVPAMRILNELGGPRVLHERLLELGLDTIGPEPDPYGLGLTLGNAPVRLLDLTNAYATLAEWGIRRPVKLWLDGAPDPGPADRPDLPSAIAAHLIAEILADAEARAPAFGRGGPLELPFRCAAKTGTSSDYRDNWCLGFTAGFTVGVWAGNFDNSPMKGVSGLAGAGPIFRQTMLRLHRDTSPTWPARPDGIVDIPLDPLTGTRVSDGAGAPISAIITPVPSDRQPLPASAADRDGSGRVLLDASYSEWYSSSHNRRRHLFAIAQNRPSESPLRILAPRDGDLFLLDPELPNGGLLHLATNLPGHAVWSSDSLELRPGVPEPVARLTPGEHVLTATDPRGGTVLTVRISVAQR